MAKSRKARASYTGPAPISGGHLIALEPRMMFDGAAVATAVEAVAVQDAQTLDGLPDRDVSRHDYLNGSFDPTRPGAVAASLSRDGWMAETPVNDFSVSAAPADARDMIFIDTNVTGYAALAQEWAARGTVVLIDGGADGIDQVRAALAGQSNIGAIHIVSHGVEGAFFLGTTRIDQTAINGSLAGSFAAIGRSLSATGDILIYGCDVGAGAAGQALVDDLARITQADVGASLDDTGFALRGGNWSLERTSGLIDERALYALTYEGILAPAVITISPTTVLRVFDATGTVVANSSTGTGFTGGQSVGATTGGFAVWSNAGTVGGQAIDLRAVVVSTTGTDNISFNQPSSATNDPSFLLRAVGATGTASAQVRWEIVLAGTNTPVSADITYTIADIDGTGANPNAPTRESVVVSTDSLSSFQSAGTSDIRFVTSTAGVVLAYGTQNELANPPLPISAARFNWLNTSNWVITYNLERAAAGQAGFNHDGNNDFNLGTGGVTTSIPRLDLDANDSTATGTSARRTFVENGAAVSISDSDVTVTNPVGIVQNGTVVLTNAQTGDVLSIGTLPTGITGAIDTSVAGRITVTLTGAASAASYQAAFAAITFRNTTERPATVDRNVTASFSNGTFNSNLAVSTITVTEVNDPPVATSDVAATNEDTPVTIAVLGNDTDLDGDPLTVTTATAPNGTVVRNANGTITYTPNANFNGTDTITYTISDGRGGTSTATVTVTIAPVNDAPVPVGSLPARANVDATAGISVATAGGFTDLDNATLTYSATGLPAGLSINATTGVITGTIDRSASQTGGGNYAVVVTARDAGGLTATQSFGWTVTNPAPVAANDAASTSEDTSVSNIVVLANDGDPDGDPLSVTTASAANGTVTINANGTLNYTPNANFNGSDTITYTISDGQGGTSTAQVIVTVAPVNDAPVRVGTLPAQTNLDAVAVSVATATAFTDVDNATLTYSATGLPAGLTINTTTGMISGTIDRSASQTAGGVYNIVVTATDAGGLSATQPFTWTVTNPAPVATNDSATTNEDTAVTIPVLANDSDPDGDPLTVTTATAPNGTVSIGAGGVLTYTPNANFNGTDTITYTISDGQGGTSTARVTVTIAPVNDAPITLGSLPARTNVDAATGVSVATAGGFADIDNATLTYSATGLPAGLSINASTGVITGTIDRSASQVNGGVYAVVVTARDAGGLTATQSFGWTVTNPAPTAANDTATTLEDTAVTVSVLANDSDPDGDPLSVVSATAANGTVVVNANGSLTYTPNANFNGSDTITYRISDGQGGFANATVAVTVTAVNDAPVATTIAPRANLDAAVVSVPVASAFSDPDGNTLTYSATGLPAGLSINATTGVISGAIDRSASQTTGGIYTVAVTANDGNGGSVTSRFAWTVTNPGPVAVNDAVATNEDTAVAIPVLANDADSDGDPLTITSATAPNGSVSIGAGGVLTYTPNANFSGTDTITYRISDGQGGTATATVAVTVNAVNDTPVAGALGNQSNLDSQPVSLPVAGAFSDPDGDPLTFAATGLPAGLVIDAVTGVISGTINRSASQVNGGVYTVVVTASDGKGGTITSTFTWTVANPAPVAANDSATANEDTALRIPVLANDSDPDGDPLTVTAASAGHGTIVINPDGTLTYTPDADFNGTDTIIYSITDSEGGASTASVSVAVRPVNDAPVTVGLRDQSDPDVSAITVPVASAFSDVDGDALNFVATGLPPGLSIDPATGLITGTLVGGASNGGPAADGSYPVTVFATDPSGATVSATFVWRVQNIPPVANDDMTMTNEDTAVTYAVLSNDTDIDGDVLRVSAAVATNGTVVINGDNTVTFTPAADFTGVATVTYDITDSRGGVATATLTITIAAVNDQPDSVALPNETNQDNQAVSVNVGSFFSDRDGDVLAFAATGLPAGLSIDSAGRITGTIDRNASQPNGGVYSVTVTATDPGGLTTSQTFSWTVTNPAPTAFNDAATTAEDTAVTIPLTANDVDPDGDPLTITAASASNGSIVINANGSVTYTPNANFNGTDTILYTVSDGNGGFSTAAAIVTVTAVNDAPVATNDTASTNEDAPVVIAVLANDVDPDGDPLTVTAATAPNGSVTINPDGTIRYVPNPNFSGTDTITYTISDGNGGTTTATVTVTVASVNDLPVAANDSATTNEDTPVTVPVLANDTDPDGNPLTVVSATAPNGTVVINPDGTITYTPNANFNGTDTISYQVSDGQGGFATATVTVTVVPVNDAPTVVRPIAPQTNVDAATVSVPTAASFADLDGNTLTYSATGLPAGLSINATTGVISGTIDRSASQPNGGIYNVVVTASDGNGGSVTSSFGWTVTNPAPTAANDTASTNEDAPVTIAVLANDSDPDGDPLSVASASAVNGTVVINANGTITYTPRANFNGTDTITYAITDGQGGMAMATVTVTVAPVNDAPTASAPLPPQANVDAAAVSVATSGNFTDLDGNALTFSATGLPAGLTINAATGVISGIIDRSASQANGGVYSVAVTASDGNGGSVTSAFVWTVTNPGPVATDDSTTTAEDTAVTIAVLANDSDPDGDPLSVATATAANGIVVINANGTITYTPRANFNGTDTITYTISDGQGGTSTATVTVTVSPVNDAPRAVSPIAAQTDLDGAAVSVPVGGNFTDLDGDVLTFSATGLPGGLSINATTGEISGTVDRSASQVSGGVYSITVTASDGNGGSVASTFSWTVTNPGPAPANDTAATAEDTPVIIPVLVNDSDPDGDPLAVTAANAANGTVVINPDGTITYTPRADFNGTDTITYAISDGQGGTATATVTVTVSPQNDAPQVDAPLADRTNRDAAAVSVPTAPSFSDLDGNTLNFSATGLPAGLAIDTTTGVISGTIDRSASQTGGGVYTVAVTASDGNGGTATSTFTWTVTNPGPAAVNDTATTSEDTPVIIPVLGNDSDPDGDPLAVTAASAANGIVTINPDGTITYTPAANFNGTDTISYTISDGQGGTSTASVTVTVAPVNDAPVAVAALPDLFDSNLETLSVALAPAFSDVDGNTLTYAVTGLPDGLLFNPATGTIFGTVSATASAGGPLANGVYPVTVTVSDGQGGSVTTTFNWTINNTPPLANDDIFVTNEDQPVTMNVLGNDVDPDGNNTTPIIVTNIVATNGTAVLNPNGTISFTPNPNFNGTATVTYTISDQLGGFSTATATIVVNPVNDAPTAPPLANQSGTDAQAGVSIPVGALFRDIEGDALTFTATNLPAGLTINPATGVISGTIDRSASQVNGGSYAVAVTASDGRGGSVTQTFLYTVTNPGPAATNDLASTNEDTPVIIPVLVNDSDPDGDPLTVTLATAPNGTVVINGDGTVTYTPDPDFNGTDTITYTISDGQGGTSVATVTVTVVPVNDAPVATALSPRSNLDAAIVSVPTAANFSDVDRNTLAFSATGLPAGLTIDSGTGVIAGTIDRSASQANGGVYNVTVTASDGQGGSASSSFVWTVTNPGPAAVDDVAATSEDTALPIAVLGNDSDPDGDSLTVTTASAANGTVVINADGTVTYTPNANFNGTDTLTYTISDGQGGTSTAVVTITVAPVNDAPTVVSPLPAQANVDAASVSVPTAGNFADLDGNVLSFSAAGLPAGLTINSATGVISGLVDRSASQVNGGVYTVAVTASDGNGGTVTSSFVWTVTNPGPAAVNDSAMTAEDSPVIIPVLGNDTDPDGDPLTVTTASATNGTVVINADGTITYTPRANFNGTDTITYAISDGQGGTSQATVTVTVTPVNDAPVANPDTAATAEETAVTVLVLGNDTDLDGNPLTVTSAAAPNGTVVINPDGTVTYTPNANFNGTDTITYTISDGAGGTATSTVTVTVSPVNDAPVANPDAGTTSEDTPVTLSPLANDTDIDGNPLTVTGGSAPNGTVVVNPDGTITYTPNANFNGTDTITYTISDGQGGTATATITVTVAPVNDPPVAVNDVAATNEDTPVTVAVLGNDSDPDGNPLLVTAAVAANGTVVINGDGTVTYTPNANFNGTDTISYTISDGAGGFSSATVTVTVAPVNDAPVANPDAATTPEDAPVRIPVLANDTDLDGNPLTVTSATAPNGTVVINPDGTITYTPNPNFNGPDTITYTISDGQGGTATTTVAVTVTPVNDAPVAVNDVATTNEDTPVVIAPLTGDSDPDGDPLTVSAVNALHGTVVINPDGTITYTPDANYNGPDTITYTISDGAGGFATATIAVSVAPVNDVPVANPDAATTAEDTAVTVPVLANDSDLDGNPLSVTAATAPNGSVVINPDGTVTYTPNANFSGTDTITYTISDGQGGTATSTVTITVTSANDPPVAVNDAATTPEDVPVTVPVLANDTDIDGNPLTVTAASAPNGTVVINPDGTLTYTPRANFNGTDTITYAISDGAGGVANATVTITVTPVNDAPVAVPDAATTAEDTPVTISPLVNDSDVDGDPLTITTATAPNGTVVINPNGTITYTPNANFNGADVITYTISDGNGGTATTTIAVTVTPVNDAPTVVAPVAAQTNLDADTVSLPTAASFTDIDGDPLTFTATGLPAGLSINPVTGVVAGVIDRSASQPNGGVYSVTVTASDGQGGSVSTVFAWTVTNPAPTAVNDVAATNEDTAVTIAVLGNDTDPDRDPLTVTAATAPNGIVVINADGTITYTPNANFNGTDTITYVISDGQGGTATATVTVTVTPVNDPPVAVNDNATTLEDTPVTVAVLGNDSDVELDPLTVTAATAPNGTVVINADGTLTYTPNANFNGTDTITYTISDGQGGTATATVTVTVTPVNDLPIAANDVASTNEDAPLVIAPLVNDSDVDGDPLTITAATAPNGTVTINPDGTLRYVPNPNFNGTDTISYTISDGQGGTATATVTVTVTPVNDPPVAVNDNATTLEDTPVTVAVLGNDSDVDNDPLTVTAATAPNGTVVINADGTLTYTPRANFNGTDTITYTISDGQGGTATATVTVTVTPVNDLPTDGNEFREAIGGTAVTVPVLANANDIDGNPLTVISAIPSVGVAVINADGTISFTAPPTFQGVATVTYTVSDGQGGTVTSTITFNVTAANIDVRAQLDFGEVKFPDVWPLAHKVASQSGFINTPLIILDAVNSFRSLSGTPEIDVQSPLLAMVNGIAPLYGNTAFDVEGQPVSDIVAQLDRITDFRFGMDRLFDKRFGDFAVEGFTGFSVRPQGLADRQVMIESVVRDQRIYMEMRDVGTDGDPMIIEHQVRMRSGGPLPDWIKVDKRGLAIIERPLDMDEIHLIVRSIRADGKVIEVPIVIQGATGEIQLDKPLPSHGKTAHAPTLDHSVGQAQNAVHDEIARIADAFGR
jgi:large repetitive protein